MTFTLHDFDDKHEPYPSESFRPASDQDCAYPHQPYDMGSGVRLLAPQQSAAWWYTRHSAGDASLEQLRSEGSEGSVDTCRDADMHAARHGGGGSSGGPGSASEASTCHGGRAMGGAGERQVAGGARNKKLGLKQLREELASCTSDADVAAALRRFGQFGKATLPTLTKLIARYSKSRQWRRGVAVFNHLHELSHTPDLEVANATLFACHRGGSAAEAWHVYRRMCELHIVPDRITFKALLPVLGAADEWQACLECFVAGARRGSAIEGTACLALLTALKRAGQWRAAEVALLCMLGTAAFQEHAEHVIVMLGETDGHPAEDGGVVAPALLKLFTQCFAQVHSHWQGHSGGQRVSDCSSSYVQQHVNLNTTANYITAAPAHDATPTHTPKLVSELPTDELLSTSFGEDPLATACCNTLLLMYADAFPSQPSRAVSLLHAMAESQKAGTRLAPDTLSYNIAIKLHCKSGLREDATYLSRILLHTGLTPTAATLEPLLTAAHAAGDRAAVLSTWHMATSFKVNLGATCGLAFISAASALGTYEELQEAGDIAAAIACSPTEASCVSPHADSLLHSWANIRGPSAALALYHRLVRAGVAIGADTVATICRAKERRLHACGCPSPPSSGGRAGRSQFSTDSAAQSTNAVERCEAPARMQLWH
eukprot:jgi/Ulvmu1/8651/UM046_0056.1